MAYTFFKVSNSIKNRDFLFDEAGSKIVNDIWHKEEQELSCSNAFISKNLITADYFAENGSVGTGNVENGILDGWMGIDIGLKFTDLFTEPIKKAKFIVWNGPAGVFESSTTCVRGPKF